MVHQEKVYQDAGVQTNIISRKKKAPKQASISDIQEKSLRWSVTVCKLRDVQNNSAKLIQVFWRLGKSDKSNEKNNAATIIKRDIHRRLNPSCAADFKLLRSELVQWRDCRLKEIRITDNASVECSRTSKTYVLTQETKILNKIDELQRDCISVNKGKSIDAILKKMTTPKKWRLKSGEVIEVVTPITLHEKELATLYMQLANNSVEDGKLQMTILPDCCEFYMSLPSFSWHFIKR